MEIVFNYSYTCLLGTEWKLLFLLSFFPFPLLCVFMTPAHLEALPSLTSSFSLKSKFLFFKGLQEAIVPLAPAMCVCLQSFLLSWCCACHVFVVKAGLWFVMMAGHEQGYDRIREKVCERLAVVILSMRKVCDDLQKRKPAYFFYTGERWHTRHFWCICHDGLLVGSPSVWSLLAAFFSMRETNHVGPCAVFMRCLHSLHKTSLAAKSLQALCSRARPAQAQCGL